MHHQQHRYTDLKVPFVKVKNYFKGNVSVKEKSQNENTDVYLKWPIKALELR